MKKNHTYQRRMLSSTRMLFLAFLFLLDIPSYGQSVTAILTGTCPGTVTLNIGADVNGKHAYSGTYQGYAAVLSWSSTNARWELSVAIPFVGGVLFFNNTNTSLDPPCYDNGVWTSMGYCAGSSITGSSGSCIAAAIPIELLLFAAERSDAGHLLKWQTATETNNKGFQIERLMDNGQWTILGFVKAQGKAATYEFKDNQIAQTLKATAYYRLRQVDNDGKETLSKVVSVFNNKSTKLKLYPSVTTDILTIETAETGDYQVFNLLGQQVFHGKTPPSGVGGLDLSALPQGTYILKVGTEQAKFVKP